MYGWRTRQLQKILVLSKRCTGCDRGILEKVSPSSLFTLGQLCNKTEEKTSLDIDNSRWMQMACSTGERSRVKSAVCIVPSSLRFLTHKTLFFFLILFRRKNRCVESRRFLPDEFLAILVVAKLKKPSGAEIG